MAPRTFTVEEAERLLPQIETHLTQVKSTLDRMRDVRDQLTDLRIIWGERIADPTCPDAAEYEGFLSQFRSLESDLSNHLDRVRTLGCEVKDPDQGLIDFFADRRGELVYLCWRRGEPRIGFWHTLTAGYAGRQPIAKL